MNRFRTISEILNWEGLVKFCLVILASLFFSSLVLALLSPLYFLLVWLLPSLVKVEYIFWVAIVVTTGVGILLGFIWGKEAGEEG